MRSFFQTYVLTAVSGVIGGDEQVRLRALLRYVLKIPPLSEIPGDDVVTLVGPTVNRYLTADAAELGLPD